MLQRVGARRAVLGLGVVVSLVFAGVAFAYFSSTGQAQGSSAVGASSAFVVQPLAATGGPLFPGAGTTNVAYTVTNAGAGHELLGGVTAVIAQDASGNILQGGVAVPGCLASWFSANVNLPTDPALPADLAGGATATGGSVDVTMADAPVAQMPVRASVRM